jgi:hypothetical protein
VGRCEGPTGREEERGGEARLCITSVSLQAGCDMLCACMTAMSQCRTSNAYPARPNSNGKNLLTLQFAAWPARIICDRILQEADVGCRCGARSRRRSRTKSSQKRDRPLHATAVAEPKHAGILHTPLLSNLARASRQQSTRLDVKN